MEQGTENLTQRKTWHAPADAFRNTVPIDPTTGEKPLFVPNTYPGYRPAYYGCEPVDANLIIEGGSMRVQYISGVLDYMSDRGFFPKNVIGVSAGVLAGFNYIVGARGRTCALNIGFCGDKSYMSLWSYLHTGNAFNAELSFERIPFELIPYRAYEFFDSPCKLTAVATNLRTNQPRYFEVDNPIEGMRYMKASSSMPFVSQSVVIDGDEYLDGGVSDEIPIRYSMQTGAKKHIVVLTRDKTFVQKPNVANDLAYIKYRQYPEFAKAVTKRYELVNNQRSDVMELAADGKVFLFMPNEPIELDILENDPRKLYEVYEMGYNQAADQWDELEEYMNS